jgi:hypothetical protein
MWLDQVVVRPVKLEEAVTQGVLIRLKTRQIQ